jgi:hypothetical protein
VEDKMTKFSYDDFRSAIDDAFTARICDPTVFWNETDGFYVAPSRKLVPNRDYCVGAANYILPSGKKSLSTSRKSFSKTVNDIREQA